MNLLFICTFNQLRSPTAVEVFKNYPGISARSAGTSSTAVHRVNATDILWSDLILVMEKKHQEIIQEKFPAQIKNKKVINLNIPDEYTYMDPELIEMIRTEVTSLLQLDTSRHLLANERPAAQQNLIDFLAGHTLQRKRARKG